MNQLAERCIPLNLAIFETSCHPYCVLLSNLLRVHYIQSLSLQNANNMSVEIEKEELCEAERRRKLVRKRLESLMQTNSQLYYEATPVVARAVHDDFQSDKSLGESDRAAVDGLSVRDIEVILAFK